jgi:branched-chain amino acid transport system permease protein
VSRLLQTLFDSVTVGSLYGLIALGYTMVYGILQFINFAHSDVFMLGAWFSYLVAKLSGWTQISADKEQPSVWAGPFVLAITMSICGTIGFLIERLAYKPLRKAPRLNVLITAIGVSLLIENVGQLKAAFGPQPVSMPALIPDVVLFSVFRTESDPGVQFHLVDLLVIAVAVGLMIALQWLVYGTKLGLGMRAVSFDTRTASLMGINVDRVISFTFVTGSALAAAAGLLFALKYPGLKQAADATWVLLGLKAFVAAVVGGIGNVRGAVVGGLLIGVLEEFGVAYVSPTLRDVYVFALLILVLLVRPTGLLGKPLMEKV